MGVFSSSWMVLFGPVWPLWVVLYPLFVGNFLPLYSKFTRSLMKKNIGARSQESEQKKEEEPRRNQNEQGSMEQRARSKEKNPPRKEADDRRPRRQEAVDRIQTGDPSGVRTAKSLHGAGQAKGRRHERRRILSPVPPSAELETRRALRKI